MFKKTTEPPMHLVYEAAHARGDAVGSGTAL